MNSGRKILLRRCVLELWIRPRFEMLIVFSSCLVKMKKLWIKKNSRLQFSKQKLDIIWEKSKSSSNPQISSIKAKVTKLPEKNSINFSSLTSSKLSKAKTLKTQSKEKSAQFDSTIPLPATHHPSFSKQKTNENLAVGQDHKKGKDESMWSRMKYINFWNQKICEKRHFGGWLTLTEKHF